VPGAQHDSGTCQPERKQIEAAPKKSREGKRSNWQTKPALCERISPWLERQFGEAAAAAERSLNPPMAGAQ
jgi:hypothetical protein